MRTGASVSNVSRVFDSVRSLPGMRRVSRPSGLVVTNPQFVPPLSDRDEIALVVSFAGFVYGDVVAQPRSFAEVFHQVLGSQVLIFVRKLADSRDNSFKQFAHI